MNRQLNNIAVDLTPVLPGGANGGAKIFVLELLRRLAEKAPQTQFILLTQALSHEELAALDGPNVRRLMVVGPATRQSLRLRLMGLARRILPHLPGRLRRIVGRLGYKLNVALKRGGSGTLLRDMSIDLLFCPFTAPTYYEPGIPTVCTIYDLQYKTYPEFFPIEEVAHRDRVFIEACRRATVLAAISDYSRASAIAHGGVDPSCIRTIHLRMPQRITPRDDNAQSVLARYELTPGRYLIYPANFWEHKNHQMLLTAFGMACHEGLPKDIKLVCTGAPGSRQEWLMDAARAMGLADRVLFPGYLTSAELDALMANCSSMVFPSLYEGFGLPIVEAMAAGVPVACSNRTALPEVAADAATLFDPRVPSEIARAMVAMMKDEVLRSQLIQAGLQRATVFADTDRMVMEYWDVFQYALSAEKQEKQEKQESLLTGVHADGWVGSVLNIQVASDIHGLTIEIEFFMPKWLPQRRLNIQASHGGQTYGPQLEMVRGTKAVFSLSIEPGVEQYKIHITPTFVPAQIGDGDDERELSVILQRCSLVNNGGKSVELLAPKVSS